MARRARVLPRAMVGMMVAHLGVAAFIIGVTMVKGHEVERDVKMGVGDDTTEVGGYTFTLRGVRDVAGPNYRPCRATIEVSRDGTHRCARCSPRSASTACRPTR